MYTTEIKSIEALLQQYFQGIYTGDTALLGACFHANVSLYGDINGQAYFKSVEDYLEGVQNRKSPSDNKEAFKMKILGIEILETVAIAKLHVPMLGYNYYDYVSLAKIGEEWKIVNKVFAHQA